MTPRTTAFVRLIAIADSLSGSRPGVRAMECNRLVGEWWRRWVVAKFECYSKDRAASMSRLSLGKSRLVRAMAKGPQSDADGL